MNNGKFNKFNNNKKTAIAQPLVSIIGYGFLLYK